MYKAKHLLWIFAPPLLYLRNEKYSLVCLSVLPARTPKYAVYNQKIGSKTKLMFLGSKGFHFFERSVNIIMTVTCTAGAVFPAKSAVFIYFYWSWAMMTLNYIIAMFQISTFSDCRHGLLPSNGAPEQVFF